MTESHIIFYDLASNRPGFCWSPNTWKTRFTLNYKGIPYKTEWLEFPDIEKKCKEMGIPPSTTNPDGSDKYTLPSIWDPKTKTGVSESYRIAKYLDKTYPDTPRVLFDGIEAYDPIINDSFRKPEFAPLIVFLMSNYLHLQNPASRGHYEHRIQTTFGKNLEDVFPTTEAKAEAWKSIKKGFDIVYKDLQERPKISVEDGQLSYVDIVLGGCLYAFRLIWAGENEFWKDILTWNDGIWGKYVEKVEKYATPKDRN